MLSQPEAQEQLAAQPVAKEIQSPREGWGVGIRRVDLCPWLRYGQASGQLERIRLVSPTACMGNEDTLSVHQWTCATGHRGSRAGAFLRPQERRAASKR